MYTPIFIIITLYLIYYTKKVFQRQEKDNRYSLLPLINEICSVSSNFNVNKLTLTKEEQLSIITAHILTKELYTLKEVDNTDYMYANGKTGGKSVSITYTFRN